MQMWLRGWHALYAGRRFCDLNCCQCRLCLTGVHSAVWKPFSLEHALKNIAVQLSNFDKWNNLLEVSFGQREVNLQHFSMRMLHIKHKGELNYHDTFLNLNSPRHCACAWILRVVGVSPLPPLGSQNNNSCCMSLLVCDAPTLWTRWIVDRLSTAEDCFENYFPFGWVAM